MFERGSRIAVVIYRYTESRSRADLLFVFNAARGRLRALCGPEADADESLDITPAMSCSGRVPRRGVASTTRAAVSRESLTAAADALGFVPSRRQYDAWREKQPRPDEFAASSFIRRAFHGSWVKATAELDGLAPEVTAGRLLQQGRKFRDEEIERALELFAADVPAGQRTQRAYKLWAEDHGRRRGAVDVPLSWRTVASYFGKSWNAMIEEQTGEPEQAQRRFPLRGGGRSTRQRSKQQVLEALRQCAEKLEVVFPTKRQFDDWVRDSVDAKGSRPCQMSNTVAHMFGSWPLALSAAGLVSQDEYALYSRSPLRRMDAQGALPFLAAALRDRGGRGRGSPLTRTEYTKWRWSVILHPEAAGVSIPCGEAIRSRFDGKWTEAVERALTAKPAPNIAPHWHEQAFTGERAPLSQRRRVEV